MHGNGQACPVESSPASHALKHAEAWPSAGGQRASSERGGIQRSLDMIESVHKSLTWACGLTRQLILGIANGIAENGQTSPEV